MTTEWPRNIKYILLEKSINQGIANLEFIHCVFNIVLQRRCYGCNITMKRNDTDEQSVSKNGINLKPF